MTLRTRIAAAAGLAVAVAVLGAALAVYFGVRGQLRGEVDQALRERVELISGRPDGGGHPGGRPPPGGGRPFEGPPVAFGGPEGYTQLVLPSGGVVRPGDETEALPAGERAREIARSGEGEELRDVTVDGVHLRVLTAALPRGQGALQVARPLDEVDRQLDRIVLVLLVVGASGVALAAGLGAIVARTALAPVARFTRRTEELAAAPDPSERIEVVGSDELARLARSFNTTLDALERSVEAQRGLVADASHELRTPIASLRANIQTLEEAERLPPGEREALRADIVGELDELTALVADIVELARGSKPGEAVDDVRLDEIATAVVERARTRAGDRALFTVDVEPTLVRGEPERIQRAISNLVDNALKWSPAGRRGGAHLGERDAQRARPRAWLRRGRPPARVRAFLPRARRSRHAGLRSRTGDRPPGGRSPWGSGRGGERAGRRRADARVLRAGRGRGAAAPAAE